MGCFRLDLVASNETLYVDLGDMVNMILAAPKVNAAEVPCKIGDFVWAIRKYHGAPHPQQGKVSEMYFTKEMRLQIVVSHIARGYWGETIFATYEEAEKAIKEGQK